MGKLILRISSALLSVIYLSALTRSQPCTEEKVELICDSVSNDRYFSGLGIGSGLTCYNEGSFVVSTPDAFLSSAVDQNKSEIANIIDMEGLSIKRASMKFIPFGITQKFERMRALQIQDSGLLSVSKENLEQFGGSLIYFSAYDNKIAFIDADLFKYNRYLKLVDLGQNDLRYIEPAFFADVKKLTRIRGVLLNRAGCINQQFSADFGHKWSTFTWNNEKCNDLTAKAERETMIEGLKLKCLEGNVTPA